MFRRLAGGMRALDFRVHGYVFVDVAWLWLWLHYVCRNGACFDLSLVLCLSSRSVLLSHRCSYLFQLVDCDFTQTFTQSAIYIDDALINGNTVAYSFPYFPVYLSAGEISLRTVHIGDIEDEVFRRGFNFVRYSHRTRACFRRNRLRAFLRQPGDMSRRSTVWAGCMQLASGVL